jgi:hypothetical protein
MRVFILSIVLLFASSVYAKSFGDYEGAIYLRNYDGDTIIFNPPGLPPIINEKNSHPKVIIGSDTSTYL